MSVYNGGDNVSNYGNDIPPSVLAEQGWLYKQYFDAFRRLRGKISAITIWGMADDDTWLDSFPVDRTDYPLPFDMRLQAKPAYWGILGEDRELPGYGLKFSLGSKAGESKDGGKDTRVLTLTATNGDVGPAYATQIGGLTLRQVFGRRCSPKVTASGSYPIMLGDIATSGSASASFTVSFAGCGSDAAFLVSAPWSSSTYHTGTFISGVVARGERGWEERH